jgi:hypothetical protein
MAFITLQRGTKVAGWLAYCLGAVVAGNTGPWRHGAVIECCCRNPGSGAMTVFASIATGDMARAFTLCSCAIMTTKTARGNRTVVKISRCPG